jgi:membrane-bound serine protease (ClpP class)
MVGLAALAFVLALAAVPALAAPTDAKAAEAAESAAGSVYVVPVKRQVDPGLETFLDRAIGEAEEAKAALIVFDMDTPGGRLDSAQAIGVRIRNAAVPTVVFVSGRAASAGAYIALNADAIAMAPGSMIGAAMIVDQTGQAVDNPKLVSAFTSDMAAAAALNGRNPDIAAGMVDPERVVEMPEIGRVKEKGQILSLTADEARRVGYADHVAATVDDVLRWKGVDDRSVVEVKPTLAERIAAFVTRPGVATALLVIGIAGLAIEMLVPGFGAPGIAGLAAFALFFFGHSIAGLAGMEALVLFLLGIALLVLELFVPSFGILGVLGAAGVVAGVWLSAGEQGVSSLAVALVFALVITAAFAYLFRKRGVWNRFILREQLTEDKGFVPGETRTDLIGREGVALTPLRPAGVADIGGERVDVVTAGEYVESGRRIRVVTVEGLRVVVRPVDA